MKIAFCLYKYFPFGGLQRDFLRIARECIKRGHEVHVFTMSWEGEKETDLHIHLIKKNGFTNHGRSKSFIQKVRYELQRKSFDLVIGFNKMPGLDIYYAADVCYRARKESSSLLYKLLPRYREWVRHETAVFAAGNKTEILLIAPGQQQAFVESYQTETHRFHLLPPGIARDRIKPANAEEVRSRLRKQEKIADHELMLLMVGSGFQTKGVDRAILAFASLPKGMQKNSYLYVIGADNPDVYMKLAAEHQIADRMHFLGGRSDVPDFLQAADLLLHPAYYDNTATVLLEAIVAGLPVLTTDQCGYACYVEEADAGVVLTSPFQQEVLNAALLAIMNAPAKRQQWQHNALVFAKSADVYSMPERAVDLIETIGQRRESLSIS